MSRFSPDKRSAPGARHTKRVPADPFFPLDLNQVASANDCTGLAPAKPALPEIPEEGDDGTAE